MKDWAKGREFEFPCFRESDIFDIALGQPLSQVEIEEDFDCDSSEELVDGAVEEQKGNLVLALSRLGN